MDSTSWRTLCRTRRRARTKRREAARTAAALAQAERDDYAFAAVVGELSAYWRRCRQAKAPRTGQSAEDGLTRRSSARLRRARSARLRRARPPADHGNETGDFNAGSYSDRHQAHHATCDHGADISAELADDGSLIVSYQTAAGQVVQAYQSEAPSPVTLPKRLAAEVSCW